MTLEPKEAIVLKTIEIKGNISNLTAGTDNLNIDLEADTAFSFLLPESDFTGKRIPGGRNGVFYGKCEKRMTLSMLPACGIFAEKKAMFSLLDKDSFPRVEAGKEHDSQIAAEMVAMYRPHVKASLLLCGQINSREPGFMSAELCKPDLSVTAPRKGVKGKKICVGTLKDFPEFKVPENFADSFLSMPEKDVLWIGGRTADGVRKAANVYFSLLDQHLSSAVRVDFKHPSGWGGNEKFAAGKGQKYLQITGEPALEKNKWRYSWYPVTDAGGGDEISFTVSCRIKKISTGKVLVGIYEFADKNARKALRFQSVEVKAAPDWQTVSGKFKLHPETQTARFYFLCRNLGKGDVFQVRSLELNNYSK